MLRSTSHRKTGVAATAETLTAARRAPALRRRVIAALLLATLLLAAVASWNFIRFHLQSLAVLKIVSGEAISPTLAHLATEPVTVSDLTLQTTAGPVRVRLYMPIKHPNAPGMVVFHGVHHLGMDEPRLMAFARAMSACGLRVLTPELPDIKDYRIGEKSIDVIGASTFWFAHETQHPVSVMGLSFSGGLALVAAANPTYKHAMKMVFAVGSQAAMGRVAAYYRTGEDIRPDGTRELLPAHEYGPLVLEYEHLEEYVPAQDYNSLRAVLKAHLYEDKDAEKAAMDALNSTQRVEALQLMDTTSAATRALLQAGETKHLAEMNGLSPEQQLGSLTVPVFLLHGEGDNIIPAAETLWMASELKATTLQAALVSPVLSHLDMSQSPGALAYWRLIHFMAQVLHTAEN